jgi:hypothetical protein
VSITLFYNKCIYLSLILGFLSLILCISSITLSDTFGKESTYQPGKFQPYENPDYKIRLLYPSDWKISEQGLSQFQIAEISAPEIEKKESSLSSVILIPAKINIFAEPLRNNNYTLETYFKNFMNTNFSPGDYKIINSSSSNLAGLPAEKTVMYQYQNDSNSKVMRIIGLTNDTAYRISYYAEPGSFNEYLPVAQEMINSFEINFVPQAPLENQKQLGELAFQQPTNSGGMRITAGPGIVPPSFENNENIDLSKLPDILTVSTDNDDNDFPLVAGIGRNSSLQGQKLADISDSVFEIHDWAPKFTFQFAQGSNVGLVDLKRVIVGQIKSYNTINDVLKNSKIWKDVPLNQEVVLKQDHTGQNFMIAEVQFTNGVSGLYSGVFNNKPFGDKATDLRLIKDDLKANKDLKVMLSFKPTVKNDKLFWTAIIPTVCDDLKNFGFRVCK